MHKDVWVRPAVHWKANRASLLRWQRHRQIPQAALPAELKRTLMLPLDDLLAVSKAFINEQATRPALTRCLDRHGAGDA